MALYEYSCYHYIGTYHITFRKVRAEVDPVVLFGVVPSLKVSKSSLRDMFDNDDDLEKQRCLFKRPVEGSNERLEATCQRKTNSVLLPF